MKDNRFIIPVLTFISGFLISMIIFYFFMVGVVVSSGIIVHDHKVYHIISDVEYNAINSDFSSVYSGFNKMNDELNRTKNKLNSLQYIQDPDEKP